MQDAEDLARRFHEIYETLAPSFEWTTQERSRVPWNELPPENRKLMIAVCRIVIPELPSIRAPQHVEAERNRWQGKVGVLLTLIEALGSQALIDAAIRAVNTSPYTGHVDEPYADIASLTVQQTLLTACEAGLVRPGPNAPVWMTNEQ